MPIIDKFIAILVIAPQKVKHILFTKSTSFPHLKSCHLFLCFRYTGYCLYHLFKNNIYMLKINITVCFKIALTFSFSHLLILSLTHSLSFSFTHLLSFFIPGIRCFVHLSFIPKYLQVKKKRNN